MGWWPQQSIAAASVAQTSEVLTEHGRPVSFAALSMSGMLGLYALLVNMSLEPYQPVGQESCTCTWQVNLAVTPRYILIDCGSTLDPIKTVQDVACSAIESMLHDMPTPTS